MQRQWRRQVVPPLEVLLLLEGLVQMLRREQRLVGPLEVRLPLVPPQHGQALQEEERLRRSRRE